eukprot:6488_1
MMNGINQHQQIPQESYLKNWTPYKKENTHKVAWLLGVLLLLLLLGCWRGGLENTSDVKELVPEFYYLSSFCRQDSGEAVSSHLHEWIDLIFGCKQHGQEAV